MLDCFGFVIKISSEFGRLINCWNCQSCNIAIMLYILW